MKNIKKEIINVDNELVDLQIDKEGSQFLYRGQIFTIGEIVDFDKGCDRWETGILEMYTKTSSRSVYSPFAIWHPRGGVGGFYPTIRKHNQRTFPLYNEMYFFPKFEDNYQQFVVDKTHWKDTDADKKRFEMRLTFKRESDCENWCEETNKTLQPLYKEYYSN